MHLQWVPVKFMCIHKACRYLPLHIYAWLIYYILFFSSLYLFTNLPVLWHSARENVLTVWGVSFQTTQFVVQTELCILACSCCLNTDWTVAVWACKAVSLHEGQPQWFWGWGLTTKWGTCRREKGRDGEYQECCWLVKVIGGKKWYFPNMEAQADLTFLIIMKKICFCSLWKDCCLYAILVAAN